MTRQEAKQKIKIYEYYLNGFNKRVDHEVEVVNIRVRKDIVIADVIFIDHGRDYLERWNNCEYPRKLLDEIELEEQENQIVRAI